MVGRDSRGAYSKEMGPIPSEALPVRAIGTLTQEQAALLLSQPNVRCPTGLRNRAIMETMYRAGLRVSEVCHLHSRDIRWENRNGRRKSGGWIHVRRTKGHDSRLVPIPETLADWLSRWDMARPADAGPFFFCAIQDRPDSPRGSDLSTHYVWAMVRREGTAAGLDLSLCHPYVLRHTYATDLLEFGESPERVQRLLGHSSITVTADTYLHLRPDDLQAAVEGFDRKQRNAPLEVE